MKKYNVSPIVLRSPRICIRPRRSVDALIENRAILESFELLHEWMDWAITPPSVDDTKAYIEYSKKCWSEEKPSELPLLIFDANDENLIGAISYNAINWTALTFEIGYWANVHYSGKGLITEAVNLLVQYAFSTWDAKRIEIRCDSENIKSASIPMRLGFILEAHLKNHRVQPISKKLSGTLVFVRYNSEGLPEIKY